MRNAHAFVKFSTPMSKDKPYVGEILKMIKKMTKTLYFKNTRLISNANAIYFKKTHQT